MQCAVGGGEEQFRVLRHDAARPAARFEAALDIIRQRVRSGCDLIGLVERKTLGQKV